MEALAASDARRRMPRYQAENLACNLTLLHILDELARAKGCTPAQLALAWVLAQGRDIVPIPGTKRTAYLEENAKAAELSFSAEEMDRLTQAFPPGAVAGDRYPPALMKRVGI